MAKTSNAGMLFENLKPLNYDNAYIGRHIHWSVREMQSKGEGEERGNHF